MNQSSKKPKAQTTSIREISTFLSRLSYPEVKKYLRTPPNNYPHYLYRYLSPEISEERLRDMLVYSRFWLSTSADFNDPFDMTAEVVMNAQVLDKRKRFDQLLKDHEPQLSWKQRQNEITKLMTDPRFEKQMLEKHLTTNMQKAGVLCFSTEPKNVLMWSHYAKDHKGLVLQFELARDPEEFCGAFPVNYNGGYPQFNWFGQIEEQLMQIVLQKHPAWRYENEHRIVKIGNARTYLDLNPEALTGVICGCRIDSALKSKVLKVLRARKKAKLPDVQVYQASKHGAAYKLLVHKLSDK